LLSDTIQIVKNEIPVTESISTKIRLVNSIGFLSNQLINAIQKAILEKKLEELEKIVSNKGV
jgi:hypothetical protein